MSGENLKLVPKKFNEFTKVTDPTGCTFAGYNGTEDIQIDFSNMTPLFGVSNEEGLSTTLAGSQALVSKKTSRTEMFNISQYNNKYDYPDPVTARTAIPANLRALGQQITYKLASGKWVSEQYIGTAVSGWATVSNWTGLANLVNKSIYNGDIPFSNTALNFGVRDFIIDIALQLDMLDGYWYSFPTIERLSATTAQLSLWKQVANTEPAGNISLVESFIVTKNTNNKFYTLDNSRAYIVCDIDKLNFPATNKITNLWTVDGVGLLPSVFKNGIKSKAMAMGQELNLVFNPPTSVFRSNASFATTSDKSLLIKYAISEFFVSKNSDHRFALHAFGRYSVNNMLYVYIADVTNKADDYVTTTADCPFMVAINADNLNGVEKIELQKNTASTLEYYPAYVIVDTDIIKNNSIYLPTFSATTYNNSAIFPNTILVELSNHQEVIDSNTQSLELLLSEKLLLAKYNGTNSETVLDKTYRLDEIGDWLEIRCKFNEYTYLRDLALIGTRAGNNNVFSYHKDNVAYNCFAIRDNNLNWVNFDKSYNPDAWHTLRIDVTAAGWQLTVDGVIDSVKTKSSFLDINNIGHGYSTQFCNCTIEYVKINSASAGYFENNRLDQYSGSSHVGIDVVDKTSPETTQSFPNCIVEYKKEGAAGRQRLIIYTRVSGTNKYIGYRIDNEYNANEIVYNNQYRIIQADLYEYGSDKVLNALNISILTTGESEFTLQQTDKADHTGGYHGDEQYTSIKFFMNGALIPDATLTEDFTKECDAFFYVQESTLHETCQKTNVDTGLSATGSGVLTITSNKFVIDGVDTGIFSYNINGFTTSTVGVSLTKSATDTWVLNNVIQPIAGHPIIANHIKQTFFDAGRYKTINHLKWRKAVNNYSYIGLVCVHNNLGTQIFNENFEFADLSTNGTKLKRTGLREITYTNPDTKMGCKVVSQSQQSNLNDTSSIWVSSEATRGKYYHHTPTIDSIVNETWKLECECIFSLLLN